MPPIANSLIIRIAGVLLVLGVLFNIVMALAIFAPIGRDRSALRVFPLPAQAAAIVDVLDAAAPVARPRLLEALNSRIVSVRLVDRLPEAGEGGGRTSIVEGPIERILARYDQAFANRDVHVEVRRRRFVERLLNREQREPWAATRLYVRLHDGPWVLIELARGAIFDSFLTRGFAIISIGGIFVIVGLWLAVRQTAQPVAALAANTRDFANRLDAPAIPASGPREMRQLIGAFNQMKARIRALVTDRTRVLAAVAHDLRTYLTRLRLRAEFITDADQRARAERDLDDMAALIDDTLLFAQSDASGAASRSDLGAELVSFLSARHELGEPVELVGEDVANVEVAVAPIALQRVLSNLTDNAVRYGKRARIHVETTDDSACISVDDDGPGIPEAALDRVTAPFERLEPSRGRNGGGAGLGLAIVTSIVEGAGGCLNLSNRVEGGLRATVRFKRVSS